MNEIKQLAEAIKNDDNVRDFLQHKMKFESSDEVIRLAGELRTLSQELQKKQYDGTLDESDIEQFKSLQETYNNISEVKEYKLSYNQTVEKLREINDIISASCQMDFASAASVSSCC